MQCTDIFFLKADICQLGIDQRKVNMLAREYCEAAGIKVYSIINDNNYFSFLLISLAQTSYSFTSYVIRIKERPS